MPPLDYIEWIAGGIIILHFILIGMKYSGLPARIPTHFGIDGQPDSWGSKATILALPVLAAALFIVMLYVNQDRFLNIPDGMDPSKAIVMLRHLTVSTQLIFLVISYICIEVAMGHRSGIGRNFFILFAVLTIYPFFLLI